MEKQVTNLLLLLLCPVLVAHVPDQDLHTVLRDVRAALAEHKVKIELLQTLNQELTERLGELQTGQEEQLRRRRQKLTERLGELQTGQEEQLRRRRQICFSASLFASGHGSLGPEPTHTNLIFSSVVTNIGNAYDADTGFFTAPLRGVYHFNFFIAGGGDAGHGSGAVLVKNGQYVVTAFEHQTEGFSSTANGATLLLEAGDVVYVLQWADTVIYDNEIHHSSFSGHLLFPMSDLIQAGDKSNLL
uniref:C1q domain-containing protein n=1 Tax=Knipowitschia caucasica TaxID=637954 RepID=A0AAV2LXN8_KNICA